jgi:hypothetical protein
MVKGEFDHVSKFSIKMKFIEISWFEAIWEN